MKTTSILLLVLLFTQQLFSTPKDFPSPPEGFTWKHIEEIKGAFLSPIDWYYKETRKNNTLGIFITKENIDKEGMFLTGFTVNILKNVKQSTNMAPSEFAYKFISTASKSKPVVKEMWSNNMGPFTAYGVRLKNEDKQLGDYITHHLVIANDSTGTVYMCIFEAPEKAWATAWKQGEVIMQKLFIDSTI